MHLTVGTLNSCYSVLSAFEKSSAACISDLLRQVSNGQYLDAIGMAGKSILHAEALFSTIGDLDHHHSRLKLKGASRLPGQACPS
jgi:hypothetical protein